LFLDGKPDKNFNKKINMKEKTTKSERETEI
jgi:hypothetical protein